MYVEYCDKCEKKRKCNGGKRKCLNKRIKFVTCVSEITTSCKWQIKLTLPCQRGSLKRQRYDSNENKTHSKEGGNEDLVYTLT